MQATLKRICELQPYYSKDNTPKMQERGRLIRQDLTNHVRKLQPVLSGALGAYGDDLLVEGRDGTGLKAELPWVRFASKKLSPSATTGFYVVLHFSTDGSGVNIVVGCSSSRYQNGSYTRLPPSQLAKRCAWMRDVIREGTSGIEAFDAPPHFGATTPLAIAFENGSALVKFVAYSDISDGLVSKYLIEAAGKLRLIYDAQSKGRDLAPADQDQIAIGQILEPRAKKGAGQGFGLTSDERRAVELQAMSLASEWLSQQGYVVTDTSAHKPFDFVAERAGSMLFVEVKGTTSDTADCILMTHGEVDLHIQRKGNTALILVSKIRLDRSGHRPRATGGHLEVIAGWDIEQWILKPIAYRVTRPDL